MLEHLEEDDIESLLETTFYIIKTFWLMLAQDMAQRIAKIISTIISRHDQAFLRQIKKLPSLSGLRGLEDINASLEAIRQPLDFEETLDVFAERLGHDNTGVIQQALEDLAPYLTSNQDAVYASVANQRSGRAVTNLMRALLDCACNNSGGVFKDLTRLCMECLGLVGCLDSNQLETVRQHRSILILGNFATHEEITDFSLFLIEHVLVPSFLSVTDTRLQGFLSYVFQMLLRECGIAAACNMQNTGVVGANERYRKWIALPESTREVVAPFLTSCFLIADMKPNSTAYPIFRAGKSYSLWIRTIVLDLLRKFQNDVAKAIFVPLQRVIRVKDPTIAEFLLPYLYLHALLGPRTTDEEKAHLLVEVLEILQYQPPETATYLEHKDSRRFYQVLRPLVL